MEVHEPICANTANKHRRLFKSTSSNVFNIYPSLTDNKQGNRKEFLSPINGKYAKQRYAYLLNGADRKDIEKYNEVYYLQQNSNYVRTQRENGFEYFKFNKGYHIAFRYEQLEFLGRGSFGTVIKAFDHKTQKQVAIKALLDEESERKQIIMEIQLLKELAQHENGAQNHHVIHLQDTFTSRGFYFMVFDMNYTDLYSFMANRNFKGLSNGKLKTIGRQIADALAFSHSAKIVHSDLKPENIMFTDSSLSNVSIIDFGCACYDRRPLYKLVQSLYYRSPEVIFNFKYGCEIDVWSFGCVMFELATGKPLFGTKTEDELISRITAVVGAPPLEMIVRSKKMKRYYEEVPANRAQCEYEKRLLIEELMKGSDTKLIDLVCRCLEWLPAKRLTMKQILEHPYFK